MKAIVNTTYGSPDILQLKDVEKPIPKANEVLVKVHSASVNALDWRNLRAKPFIARFSSGLLKPKSQILGADIAGRIVAIGANVTRFKVGDEVFGDCGAGGFAEYVAISENNLALKPSNLTFEQASAVAVAALTALQGLRKGEIKSGQKVFINGASGGVGTFAVQIAKSFDVEVTAVCSTNKVEMVRNLGADHVIDYKKEDLRTHGQRYDLIFDNVGNMWASDYQRLLTPTGIGVGVGFSSLMHLFHLATVGGWVSRGSQKIHVLMSGVNTDDLVIMKDLLEQGKVVPVIDRRYPLSQVADAIRYVEEGHAIGKVVIAVE